MFVYLILVFFLSLTLSLIITALFSRSRRIAKGNISSLGGFAIWFSFILVSLFSFYLLDKQWFALTQLVGIYICSSLVFIIGLVDDKQELSVILKLMTQLLAAAIVIFFDVKTKIVGIGEFGNIVVTVLWILGITNAFNHLDIVDGLASGVAFINSFAFFLISMLTANIPITLSFLVLSGSILGFFRYNFPKASIYMGNSGSHFLGFLIGTLAIMISYASLEKRIALLMPLLVLGFPIFDTIFVIWVRTLKNKPIWQKSNDHLPLRLLSLGISEKKAIIYMFLLAGFFCFSSILILYLSNLAAMLLLNSLFILSIFIAYKAKKIKIDD